MPDVAPADAPRPRRGWRPLLIAGATLLLSLAAVALFLFVKFVPPAGGVLPVAAAGGGPQVRLEPAFEARFTRPLLLTHAPGEPERVYVVEQAGRVLRLERAAGADPQAVLDISPRVSTRHNEEGLLGLAFHPGYADNGRLFLYYSASGPRRSVLAEYARGPDGTIDPASERVVLEVPQPWGNHNGGMIAFGPDGMLYVALGDGGSAGDPQGNGQDLGELLGSILRLDVDRRGDGRGYAVPADNPFVERAGARGEVWAYGLRNPWRFSFDRATGELWAGDVGQVSWEEVDLIERGGNYGWRGYEGFSVYDEEVAETIAAHREPLAAYSRSEGGSITGGYVYRGQAVPALRGWYVYADYLSGAVWALRRRPDASASAPAATGEAAQVHPRAAGVEVHKLLKSGKPIASFGEDAAGELYVCAFDGTIYRFAPR